MVLGSFDHLCCCFRRALKIANLNSLHQQSQYITVLEILLYLPLYRIDQRRTGGLIIWRSWSVMVDYRGSNAKASKISNSKRCLMPSEGGRWSVLPPRCLQACLPHVLLVELSRYSFCPKHQLPRISFWHFDGTSCYRINLLNIIIQFIDW